MSFGGHWGVSEGPLQACEQVRVQWVLEAHSRSDDSGGLVLAAQKEERQWVDFRYFSNTK